MANKDDWEDVEVDDWEDQPEDLTDIVSNEMSAPSETPEVPIADTAMRHGIQGITMGFGDEIAGGAEAIGSVVGLSGLGGPITDISLSEEGPTLDKEHLLEQYRAGRDAERARLSEGAEANPGTAMISDIAGGVLTPIPGATALNAASKIPKAKRVVDAISGASKIKKGAMLGGGIGATEAAGRTESDLLSIDGAADVALGGVTGGVFGGVLGKLGSKMDDSALKKATEKATKLEQEANISVAKAAGATSQTMKEILGTTTKKNSTIATARSVGSTLAEEGIFKVKQSADELKVAVVDKLDEVGRRLSSTADEADKLTRSVPIEDFAPDHNKFVSKITDDIEELTKNARLADDEGLAVYSGIERVAKVVLEDVEVAFNSPSRISRLVDLKRDIQKQINWKNVDKEGRNQYLVRVQSHISELINDMTKKVSPEVAEQMSVNNKKYSDLILANKIAGDQMVKESLQTSGIGFKDYFLGGAISAVTGSKLVGAGVVAAKKITEKVTGKETGKMFEAAEALHKFRKAKNLRSSVSENVPRVKDTETKTIMGTVVSSSILDSDNAPHKMQQKAVKIAEKATPEMLTQYAQTLRDEHGKQGEQLATILDKMFNKDKRGRQTLMFQLLQNPQYRKMLGTSK